MEELILQQLTVIAESLISIVGCLKTLTFSLSIGFLSLVLKSR